MTAIDRMAKARYERNHFLHKWEDDMPEIRHKYRAEAKADILTLIDHIKETGAPKMVGAFKTAYDSEMREFLGKKDTAITSALIAALEEVVK